MPSGLQACLKCLFRRCILWVCTQCLHRRLLGNSISSALHQLAMPGKRLLQDARNAWVKRPLQPGRVAPECVWSNFGWAGVSEEASDAVHAWNREFESEGVWILGPRLQERGGGSGGGMPPRSRNTLQMWPSPSSKTRRMQQPCGESWRLRSGQKGWQFGLGLAQESGRLQDRLGHTYCHQGMSVQLLSTKAPWSLGLQTWKAHASLPFSFRLEQEGFLPMLQEYEDPVSWIGLCRSRQTASCPSLFPRARWKPCVARRFRRSWRARFAKRSLRQTLPSRAGCLQESASRAPAQHHRQTKTESTCARARHHCSVSSQTS